MAIQIPGGLGAAQGAALAAFNKPRQQAWALASSMIRTPEQKYESELSDNLKLSTEPLMEAYANPIGEWGGINFNVMGNAGKAYLDFKTSIKGRSKRYAERNNLLNPVAFKQKYDQQVGQMLPLVARKLEAHALANNLSSSDMRDIVSQHPGLKKLLIDSGYATPMIGDQANPIAEYLTEPETLGQRWGKVPEKLGDFARKRFSPGSIIPTLGIGGVGGYGAYRLGKYALGKFRGGAGGAGAATGTGANVTGAKQVSKAGVKGMLSSLKSRFGGISGMRKALVSKIGKRRALALMARLGLGGAGALSGIGTAVGLALTAATVIAIGKILMGTPEEYGAANEQRLQAVQGAAGTSPDYGGQHPTFQSPPMFYDKQTP